MHRGALRGRSNGQQRRAQEHCECPIQYTKPACPPGLAQFIEQNKALQNTQKAVGIPWAIALTKVDPHLCSDNWPTNRFTANVLSAVCLCFSPSWGRRVGCNGDVNR